MDGKIEKVINVNNDIYEVVQLRNNSFINYSKSVNGNGGGNTETLRQSLKSPVDEVLNDIYNESGLIELDSWINEYKHYYDWKKKYFPFALKELGTVSRNTQKRISKLIENVVNSVYTGFDYNKKFDEQPYITFLTTTLPSRQMHTDKVIKRAFSLFLENLVKTYDVKFYIWKAEPQKNGNIHFHVLVDRYIHHKTVRRLWNLQMKRLGYVDEYALMMKERGFVYNPKSKKSRNEQHERYLKEKQTRFQNPNSTDIHSLKKVRDVSAYMIKYMIKNEDGKRPILGRLWGCSNNVKFVKYAEIVGNNICSRIIDLAEKSFKRLDVVPFVSIYVGNVKTLLINHLQDVYKILRNHYLSIYKKLYYESPDNEIHGLDERAELLQIYGSTLFEGNQTKLQMSKSYG